MDGQTDGHTHRLSVVEGCELRDDPGNQYQTDRETNRQKDRQIDRQTDR